MRLFFLNSKILRGVMEIRNDANVGFNPANNPSAKTTN